MSRKILKFEKIVTEGNRKQNFYDDFSCDKYDNIRRKALNKVNEVDSINCQTKNNIKTKTFLCQSFLSFFSLDSSWYRIGYGIEETFRGNKKKLGTLVMYLYIFSLVYLFMVRLWICKSRTFQELLFIDILQNRCS